MRALIALFLFFGFSAMPVSAQQPQYPYAVDTKPSRGIMPNSEQLSGPLDHIDPVSGKLHIQIPLASLPAGNAGSGFDLALTYDSRLFDLGVGEMSEYERITQTVTPTLTAGGWSYNFKNYRVEAEERQLPSWEPSCESQDLQYVLERERTYRYRISLPDGSQHVLHLLGWGDEKNDGYWGDGFYAVTMEGTRSYCAAQHPSRYPANATGTLTYYTTDGSYLRFQINANGSNWANQQWTLFYPDGRRVVGRFDQAEHLYDANGNGIHITKQTENGRTVAYITDDFNRSIRVEYSLTSSSTEKEDKITVAGPNGPLEWRVKWQRIQIGGPGASYICWEESWPEPKTANCGLNFQYWVVKYIQLPLAAPAFTPPPVAPWTSFEFTYPSGTSYGFLSSMRVPSGAVYSYCCVNYSVSKHASDIAYSGYSTRTVSHDGTSEVWTYIRSQSGLTRVTNPDGGQTLYHSYEPSIASEFWKRGLIYWIEEPGGTVRKRQWSRNKVYSLAAVVNIDPNNPFVERESVTTDAVAGQPRSAVTDYAIDKNGNPLSSKEYGWSTTLAGSAMEAAGGLLRQTETSYAVSVPGSTDASNGSNRYWSPSAPLRLNAATRRTVKDGASAVKAVTEFTYDDALSKGNVRFERRWDDTVAGCTTSAPLSAACPAQHREFSPTGNLIDIFGPAIRTHIDYDNGPYPTKVTYASGARSFTYNWNAASGTLNSQIDDQSGSTTSYDYDAFGRQTLVNENGARFTRTEYFDEERRVLVKRDLRTPNDGGLQKIAHTDQLGRADLVRTSDGAPLSLTGSDGIHVQTLYQTFTGGTRVISASPYRTTDNPAQWEWSCTQNDQAGRVVAAAAFKGGTPPSDCFSEANRTGIATTSYHVPAGTPRTRVTDPAGKVIDRYGDALGRLVTVVEDPQGATYGTTYEYNVLDNLAKAIQSEGGVTQERVFEYTSLGRLRTASNPETGTIQFTYNPAGDLATRLDSRGLSTTLAYDDLHRVISKTYDNDGGTTPDVTYSYHAAGSCVGQLHWVDSAVGRTTHAGCDALGRVSAQTQSIAGAGGGSYAFSYTYWLNDSLKTMQYPSGKLLNFDVDNAGRISKVHSATKTFADLTAASTPPYRADGRLQKLKLGNGLWETRDYRAPGEATVFRLGTTEGASDRLELQYNFSATGNNGNLLSHVIRQGSTSWSQTYDYDGLNRLTCASEVTGINPPSSCSSENSWRQTFGYDRFGNRWVSATTEFTVPDNNEFVGEGHINKWTNRINDLHYDAAGNRTSYHPWTLSYDAENRMLALTSTSNGSSAFTHDGSGRRIKKETNIPTPQTTFYIYDVAGRLAAEYSTSAAASGTSYLFADLLGTPRAITASNGSMVECSDYSPFGRLLQTATRSLPCHQIPTRASQQFTGQVRDQETKLDYFGARYFSAAQGRFLSPDAPFADQNAEDPQSWNLYAYTRNNPLIAVDLDGRQSSKVQCPCWTALPNDTPTRRPLSVLLGAAKGIGLSFVDVGRFMGMPEQNATQLEGWLRYSNKREESAGKLLQFYQAAGGAKAAAAAGIGVVKSAAAVRRAVKTAESIATPYGAASQLMTAEAQAARSQIENGATLYKAGVLGRSETGTSQFLSLENPLNPGYAGRYGIPSQNEKFEFILTGRIPLGAPVITRSAPGIPPNPGGGIEAVTTPGSFRINSFYMP
jgi:RHS repeat-associated protein